ncbi:unnamed protein product [Dovyalis caffra]|uniref:Cation/H+ exchanger domain-containing protein n=1 Tax=Dovyalis caffra TaxID=77055 RepID=A0AAV1RAZ1_9ROSI|nr:unnamed protein product [Dovyalis caffra]
MSCNSADKSSGVFYSDEVLNFNSGVILIDAVLVTLMSRIIRFLLRPFKQPKVVSEIIGGIIIGPSVLSINKKFSGTFFPENAKYVIKNIGLLGFMYFLFVVGVKMDLSMVRISRRKHRIVTVVGMIVPLILATIVGNIIRPSMDQELAKSSSIGGVVSAMSVTGFVVIYPILQELNLLSSEVGQIALSVSIITDAVATILLIIVETMRQADLSVRSAAWYIISVAIFMFFSITGIGRVTIWIVEKTPEGQPVEQAYVVLFLLGALVMGFLSDMLGLGIAAGSLWLGLMIPDGPPLGSAIVDKCETFIMDFFMPLSYVYIGMFVDVFEMASVPRSSLMPLFTLAVSGIVFKLLATLLTSLLVKIPSRDALTLALILNLRGQQEFMLIMHWMDKMVIKTPSFTMMVLLTTAVTAMSTPLISFLYDPTKPFMVNARRTIQHTPPREKLKIVACFNNQDSLPSLIDLFEFSCPSQMNPLSIYALHLIELNGRAAPVFIDHQKQKMPSKYGGYNSTYNAIKLYKETRSDVIDFHSFAAVVPKQTMYQDICKLATNKEVGLIILPFHKELMDTVTVTELNNQRTPSVISNVLDHAPCSVGILVHRGHFLNPIFDQSYSSPRHFLVLFLGGADAREALCFADRMVKSPNVSLTVIRFLSYVCGEEYEQEKKLDDGLITLFWARHQRDTLVTYREVVVKNGEETLATVQAFGNNAHFDLRILGRNKGINPVLLEGLSNWSEHHELGVIGDYISSMDFDGTTSVLVVQQQILRG